MASQWCSDDPIRLHAIRRLTVDGDHLHADVAPEVITVRVQHLDPCRSRSARPDCCLSGPRRLHLKNQRIGAPPHHRPARLATGIGRGSNDIDDKAHVELQCLNLRRDGELVGPLARGQKDFGFTRRSSEDQSSAQHQAKASRPPSRIRPHWYALRVSTTPRVNASISLDARAR